MYLGIDVGGTHTDGARLDDTFTVVKTAKVLTRPGDVLAGLLEALRLLLKGADPAAARRLVISSTLGLNAILTGQADRVGVLTTGGPGLAPPYFADGPLFAHLSGSQDHRGETVAPQPFPEALAGVEQLLANGAQAFAVISKFGPKNPALETLMAQAVYHAAPGRPVTLASRLAGRLNFPRRLNTAVFNSSVIRLYKHFLADLRKAAESLGLVCPIRLLTADGGFLGLQRAAETPVHILAAGPAAGLLGLWSLAGLEGDALMVDVGGTSTDLAVMTDGEPLMTAEGLEIAGRPTLTRAFLTRSVALGGDSVVTVGADGLVAVGPGREGPALALAPGDLGRRRPTLTDALNVLGQAAVGSRPISRQALAELGPPEEIAGQALQVTRAAIARAADDLLRLVNNRPVYTIDAVRLARQVRPARAALLGGPAQALAPTVSQALGLPVTVPTEAEVANAVGAACSRPTLAAELYADTALGTMNIPSLNITRAIDREYTLKEAEADLLSALREALAELPESGPPQIIEAESFSQLTGYGRADKIYRLRAQTRPGVLKPGDLEEANDA